MDCFHPENMGNLLLGKECYLPATPHGVIELIQRSNIETKGKNCVIVGRSNIVGKPLAMLMLQKSINATVTVCHSHTQNLKKVCKGADILIVAIGQPEMITADYVKEGATVIDVGIHRLDAPELPKGYRLCGDVLFEEVVQIHIKPLAPGIRRVGLDFRVAAAKSRVDYVPSRKVTVKGIKIPREGSAKEIRRVAVELPKGQRTKPHSSKATGERVLDGLCKPKVRASREEELARRIILVHHHLDRIEDVGHLLHLIYDNRLAIGMPHKSVRVAFGDTPYQLIVKRISPSARQVNHFGKSRLAGLPCTGEIHTTANLHHGA
jgi:hypothetical protein